MFHLTTCKKTRKHWTNKQKLQVLEAYESHGAQYCYANFGVCKSSLYRWKKDAEGIKKRPLKQKINHPGRKTKLSKLQEDQLMQKVSNLRQAQIPVSGVLVQVYAKQLARKENVTPFTASAGWLARFKKRHDLSFRKGTRRALSHMAPDMLQRLTQWHARLSLLSQHRSPRHRVQYVLNIDETPVYYDLTFDKTLAQRGSQEVLVRAQENTKKRITVILGIILPIDPTAKQIFKCKPMMIVKGKTERVYRDIEDRNNGKIILARNEKAWCTQEDFCTYLEKCIPEDIRGKSIVTWDNFAVHLTEAVQDKCKNLNIYPLPLPANTTSFIQPLDVGVNRPFKHKLKTLYRDWMIGLEDGESLDVGRNQLYKWVSQAWDETAVDTIKNSFRACGFGVAPEKLSAEETYWKALPSLQRELGDDSSAVFSRRTYNDENHPSVCLFNAVT